MSRLVLFSVCLACLCGSCAFPDYSLDEADSDPRVDEMRRRMNVRVTRRDSSGDLVEEDKSAAVIRAAVQDLCQTMVDSESDCPRIVTDSECYVDVCQAEVSLCVANELMNYASFGAGQSTLTIDGTEWTVPAQAAPARAALSQRATEMARSAATYASGVLHDSVTVPCNIAGEYFRPPGPDELTVGQAAAATLSESLMVARDAAQVEVSSLTAVADGQFSDQSETSEAAYRAWSLAVGS